MSLAPLLLVGWILGCSDAPPVCPSDAGELVTGIACTEARRVLDYTEQLAGREVPSARARIMMRSMQDVAADDPEVVRASLVQVGRVLDTLDDERGLVAAALRSRLAWAAVAGDAPFPAERYPTVAAAVASTIAVWSQDDPRQLVLTEMDVEGVIRYASLVREVQGAPPLSVALSDRVAMYRSVRTRWDKADEEGRIALTAFGAFWPAIRKAWLAAPYERQQAWIKRAPLPEPMQATSSGFVDALVQGDVSRHARVLHELLGPFSLSTAR